MSRLPLVTPHTAVGAARDMLAELMARHGQVGDMVRTMADSPAVLGGFLQPGRTPRETVTAFYEALASSQSPEHVALLFSETAEWEIWGDVHRVPWAGHRVGRTGVAGVVAQLRELTEPLAFDVHRLVVERDTVVAIGRLATRVNATGRLIESPFAAHVVVRHGLIETYRFFEDTWAVAQAMRPP